MIFAIFLLSAAAAAGVPQSTDQSAAPNSAFGKVVPVDDSGLDRATARADLSQVAVSEQTSTVSNNVVSGSSVTGQVAIGGNAFQNVQGLSIINANSGNNVSINASLTVNLHLSPAP